jgi:hypothetical protein
LKDIAFTQGNAKGWYNEGIKTNGEMRRCVLRERSYMEVGRVQRSCHFLLAKMPATTPTIIAIIMTTTNSAHHFQRRAFLAL